MTQAGQGILSDKVMPDQTPKGSEGVSQAGTRKRVPGREEATRSLAGLRMDGRDPTPAVTSCMTGSSSSLAILGGSQPRGPQTRSARRARGLPGIQPTHLHTHSVTSPALREKPEAIRNRSHSYTPHGVKSGQPTSFWLIYPISQKNKK